MSDIVKNQHYVPQFYLNYFANKNGRIFVYDKINEKKFPSNSRGIASEGYFYDIIKGKMQSIEKYLNRDYESAFSKYLPSLIQRLENDEDFYLTSDDKKEIASFLSLQYVRTKRFREESVRLFTSQDIYHSEAFLPPKMGHIILFSDPDLLDNISANLLQNYYWVIGKNETSEFFYTSDNPFAQRESMREVHKKHQKEFADFSLLSYEIALPLTPKYLITFYIKDKQFEELKDIDGTVYSFNKDNVQWFNNLQFMKCYRQLYSCTDDFTFVENIWGMMGGE
ncbi:DUF4238 domain-containing protein [Halobacillus hunanensis]|uniref:DUF4238 domain-containing protein n=1 Tax=Halobacillus hunanensis TaxID=578214 RepID=UPI0009A8B79E|nr:DUF4238 domain-containing protein [Halobacillus hunanensis]